MSPRRPIKKGKQRKSVLIPGDPNDLNGFHTAVVSWLEWLEVHNYSPLTILDRSWNLSNFINWAEPRGITRPDQVTLKILEAYQRYVANRRKKDGMPLAYSTQSKALIPLKGFFAFLTRQHEITSNPASELIMPKKNHPLPKATLTHLEVETVVSVPDISTPIGLSDRVILEVLYATAIRRGELVNLNLEDVDLSRNYLTLRYTKTRYDRVVPMGQRATSWIVRYLTESRDHLIVGCDPRALFLAANGERLGPKWLSSQVRNYVLAADIKKSGSCHLFRHTAATLMVENGADIRYVQELLGHRDLNSTTIYTHVSPDKLAKIHAATHPGALLKT
jgi:integrase/recombinase XerD